MNRTIKNKLVLPGFWLDVYETVCVCVCGGGVISYFVEPVAFFTPKQTEALRATCVSFSINPKIQIGLFNSHLEEKACCSFNDTTSLSTCKFS